MQHTSQAVGASAQQAVGHLELVHRDFNGNRLLNISAVVEMCGISRSQVYKRVADGTFPQPVKLSSTLNLWSFNELQQWVADLLARRSA
jgi:prophage regulatory protein